MAGTLTPTPYQTVLDADGVAVSGALIYTYTGGTSTAAATYTTADLSVANANPIVADSGGRYVAYLTAGANMKFVFKTSAGATIRTQDDILSVPGTAVNLDIQGIVGQAVTAGQVCYLSSGAETVPLTAGLWYLTDADAAATSTTCQSIGVAVSAIAINTAGTIRLAGVVTSASAVVTGSTYYVSATAGAITTTAPALSRTVGVATTTSTLLLAATTAVVASIPNPIVQDLLFTDATYDIGKSGATRPRDLFQSRNATIGGTLAVAGTTTLSSTVSTGALSSTTGAFSSTVTGGTYNGQTISSAANLTGTLTVTGATTLSSTVSTGALSVTGAATYTTNLKSTTAFATPSALSATQATEFASTVSGAAIMGFGTTNDVSLMNRAGTVVLGVGPNTTAVNIPGTLDVTGAVTGGTYNSQTISSAASLTGTLAVAGLLTVSGFGTNSFSGAGTGEQTLKLQNTTAGVGNYVRFNLSTDIASVGVLDGYSSTYTTANQSVQSGVLLGATAAGGLSIAATHASGAIRFYSGGTTLRGGFEATAGNFFIGPTANTTHALYISKAVANSYVARGDNTSATNPFGLYVSYTAAAPNSTSCEFFHGVDTSGTKFAARSNGGIANYSANNVNLSDATTKYISDVSPTSERELFRRLPLVLAKYLTSDRPVELMLTAQDVERVYPDLVEWFDEGRQLKGIREYGLLMRSIKVIQELDAQLVSMEARLTAAGV